MNDERAIHPEFPATWFNMNPGARHESHSWKLMRNIGFASATGVHGQDADPERVKYICQLLTLPQEAESSCKRAY